MQSADDCGAKGKERRRAPGFCQFEPIARGFARRGATLPPYESSGTPKRRDSFDPQQAKHQVTASKPKKRRRWLRIAVWCVAAGTALFGGFIAWALLTCFAEPPTFEGEAAVLALERTSDEDGRLHLGPSWFEQRDGASMLYLEGDPFTLGYANATLTAEFLARQERSLIEAVREQIPSTLGFYAVALAVLVNNRNLPEYVAHEHQLEIYGLSLGRGEDPYTQFGSRYHRLLNYHAAHDISHWVWDQPAIGCTAFAATGAWTTNGNLIIGRNFDWEAGEHFDRNKVIALYRPDDGFAFLSVTWPGMAGIVTGMNEAGVYVSINGAHSERQGTIGRPVSLVAREVLQRARDLPEAVEIIERAQVFVADSFLLADGKTGTALVVEKAPGISATRTMQDGALIQSNHFETSAFAQDRGNLDYMATGTSLARHARMTELVNAARGEIDVARAVTILRDRSGPGGEPRALGHRSTLNPMIATHAVVADLTRRELWVSRGPHQLGAFDAYGFDDFGSERGEPITPDPALADGSYERLRAARALLSAADDSSTARADMERALELNPGCPDALARLGQALEAGGALEAALQSYRAALAGQPPFAEQRAALEAACERVQRRL